MLEMSSPSMPELEPQRTQRKIVIYTTSWCPYCTRAKMLLKSKGWAFEEIDVDDDDDKRRWLREKTGMRTVPQIFVEDQSLGGYDDISALDRRGVLEKIVMGG